MIDFEIQLLLDDGLGSETLCKHERLEGYKGSIYVYCLDCPKMFYDPLKELLKSRPS